MEAEAWNKQEAEMVFAVYSSWSGITQQEPEPRAGSAGERGQKGNSSRLEQSCLEGHWEPACQ